MAGQSWRFASSGDREYHPSGKISAATGPTRPLPREAGEQPYNAARVRRWQRYEYVRVCHSPGHANAAKIHETGIGINTSTMLADCYAVGDTARTAANARHGAGESGARGDDSQPTLDQGKHHCNADKPNLLSLPTSIAEHDLRSAPG